MRRRKGGGSYVQHDIRRQSARGKSAQSVSPVHSAVLFTRTCMLVRKRGSMLNGILGIMANNITSNSYGMYGFSLKVESN